VLDGKAHVQSMASSTAAYGLSTIAAGKLILELGTSAYVRLLSLRGGSNSTPIS
jgi:hypothetical protein